MDETQRMVLDALIAAGGQITKEELEALYDEPKRDRQRVARLNRHGLTNWVRPPGRPHAEGIGLRITEHGRRIFNGKSDG